MDNIIKTHLEFIVTVRIFVKGVMIINLTAYNQHILKDLLHKYINSFEEIYYDGIYIKAVKSNFEDIIVDLVFEFF